MTRVVPILVLAAFLALGGGTAFGSWLAGNSGTGAVGAKTLPTGSVPSASVSSHDVTLTWTASQFADGTSVPKYVVKRYDAVTNIVQTVLSGCTGVLGSAGCTENSVPTGTWKYTVTPAAGNNWRGTESAKSSIVVVLI